MSWARLIHSISNRSGRAIASMFPPQTEELGGAGGGLPSLILVANRWDYGSRFNMAGYEYRRFVPSLRQVAKHVLFVPIEMREGITPAIRNATNGRDNYLVLSVFQRESDIPKSYFSLKSESCKLLNWYTDDDMHFEKFGQFIANSFDLNITTFSPNLDKFRALGAKAMESQWAGLEEIEFEPHKEYLATFIGRMYGNRTKLAEGMKARYGDRVFVSDTRVTSIDEERMIRIYRASLIAIDEPMAYDGKNVQIKARIFENSSMGCAVATMTNSRLEQYFRPGKEILFYEDYDELFRILDNAQKRPEHYQDVARAAYARARSDHTYEKRFRELFSAISADGT